MPAIYRCNIHQSALRFLAYFIFAKQLKLVKLRIAYLHLYKIGKSQGGIGDLERLC